MTPEEQRGFVEAFRAASELRAANDERERLRELLDETEAQVIEIAAEVRAVKTSRTSPMLTKRRLDRDSRASRARTLRISGLTVEQVRMRMKAEGVSVTKRTVERWLSPQKPPT